ncbi:leucine-rich repeat-containing protein 10 [Pseudophryne corroboree]|uniref:leucine-rich repeat-containing protein 10 n=1 Tax=Pseudophryne corroboree TaxID=495146 RepID=UPI003081F3AF
MGNTIRGIIAFIPSNSCQKYLLGDLEEMPIDKMVDLSSMQLRIFPLRVCAFTELIKLYLSDNNLNSLPPELELLQNLQILALDFNNFKALPLCVCSLKQLCILYLGNNHIRDLPQELSFLKNLHTLWIESNYLTHLPDVICELTLLKTLHAGSNPIRNIPMALKNLKELRSIWMSGNLLTEFPPVLLEMPFIEVIDVDRNGIKFFPSLKLMSGLKLVIYDHNPCRNAPKVAKGVRRVGRWSEETPEPKKRSEMVVEIEKATESKETQQLTVPNDPTTQTNDNTEDTTS